MTRIGGPHACHTRMGRHAGGVNLGAARQLWRHAKPYDSVALLGSPVKAYPTRHSIIELQRGISDEVCNLLPSDMCLARHERYHNCD